MRQAVFFPLIGAAMLALALPISLSDAKADGVNKAPSAAEGDSDNVEILDSDLDEQLSVSSVGSQRTNTNLLSVFATLKNLTSRALVIEAATLYKNANGDLIDGGKASWLSLRLKPHEEMEYRSASLSEDAQDFLVRIRRPGTRT
jgi:hypothetical protein